MRKTIVDKDSLDYFLECDKIALGITRKHPRFLGDYIWKYERLLRINEYYVNCKPTALIKNFYMFKMKRLAMKLGFQIPLNVVAPGLALVHPGTIIINSKSEIGENCRIQTGVTIGTTNGSNKAPIIGNNVFLGDGCKVIGNVQVADGVCVGANAVVVKTISEPNTTWGGVPAHKLSDNSSESNITKATDIVNASLGF